MRDMGKDAEAKREYDACTGRVAKTEFRRAWAERKLKVVETQSVAEPVAGQTRIQSRRSTADSRALQWKRGEIGKQQNRFAGRALLQASTSGTPYAKMYKFKYVEDGSGRSDQE